MNANQKNHFFNQNQISTELNTLLEPQKHMIGKVVCHNYLIVSLIASGTFGIVYKCKHMLKGTFHAVKLEMIENSRQETLVIEMKVMMELKGQKGFPRLYYFMKDAKVNAMVMTLLGSNLEIIFHQCKHKFTLKTVLMIFEQMINRIEAFHELGFIHRDLKPQNFVIGSEDPETLYLIDYGLAENVKNAKRNAKDKVGMVGTARYTSINSHLGYQQCRKDDLESIGYIIIFFLKGSLPWQDIKASSKEEKYRLILNMKMTYSPEKLCEQLPAQFTQYMQYVKGLSFDEVPNYKFIQKLFRTLFVSQNFEYDDKYCWSNLPSDITPQKNRKKSYNNVFTKIEEVDEDENQQSNQQQSLIKSKSKHNEMVRSNTMSHNIVKQLSKRTSQQNIDKEQVESVIEVGDDLKVLEEFISTDVSDRMQILNKQNYQKFLITQIRKQQRL